jgi:hypothetical protein
MAKGERVLALELEEEMGGEDTKCIRSMIENLRC